MFFATVKDSFVSAPLLGSDANGENGEVVDLHGVAAEDGVSLTHFTMSVRMPRTAPAEKGVLWLDMCSASWSMLMVAVTAGRA